MAVNDQEDFDFEGSYNLAFFIYLFQRTMAVNDQEDSDFEGSGDTGSGYGDSDNDYETGSGNRCGYVGDDEDYDDEGSGNDLTKFLLDFMLFFCQKQILPFYIIVCSFFRQTCPHLFPPPVMIPEAEIWVDMMKTTMTKDQVTI